MSMGISYNRKKKMIELLEFLYFDIYYLILVNFNISFTWSQQGYVTILYARSGHHNNHYKCCLFKMHIIPKCLFNNKI